MCTKTIESLIFCHQYYVSYGENTPCGQALNCTVPNKSFHVEIGRSAVLRMGDRFLSGKVEEKKLGEVVS